MGQNRYFYVAITQAVTLIWVTKARPWSFWLQTQPLKLKNKKTSIVNNMISFSVDFCDGFLYNPFF